MKPRGVHPGHDLAHIVDTGQAPDISAVPRVTSHQVRHDHPWAVPTWPPCAFEGWHHQPSLLRCHLLCSGHAPPALVTMKGLESEARPLSKTCRVILDPLLVFCGPSFILSGSRSPSFLHVTFKVSQKEHGSGKDSRRPSSWSAGACRGLGLRGTWSVPSCVPTASCAQSFQPTLLKLCGGGTQPPGLRALMQLPHTPRLQPYFRVRHRYSTARQWDGMQQSSSLPACQQD